MSSQGISRQHLMIRVDTNTSRFNRTLRNSSGFPGEAIICLSALYLTDGKQVPIYIIMLASSSPVPHNLWAYLFCSTLMTDMGTSYSYLAQRFASPVTNSHKQQPLLLFLLISAGYFVNLGKSYSQPFTFVNSLGFISDSVLQAVLVPLDKTEKCKHCVTNSWDHLRT